MNRLPAYLSILVVFICIVTLFFFPSFKARKLSTTAEDKPNVVIVFLDDGAYGDFKPFGNPRYPTPHVAELASEGRSFYNFYVPQAVCSASRAALLSGCYPGRTQVFGAHGPNAKGLDPKFATLGEVLKTNGYTTAAFGKWHIGDQEATRPYNRGFDESCGLMYSNDMWLHHPENPEYWGQWPLQYWENGKITIDTVQKEDQKMLSTWYTEKAVDFINDNADSPFFLYVAHSMPHVPIFCSDKFEGKSGTGLYGDVMMELDWSVGQINTALKKQGIDEKTLFIFIGSDNGPWLSYGDHAGITPFREGKGTTFEGGVRNPLIIKFPKQIDANTSSFNTFGTIDVLPTVSYITGTELPTNPIDGANQWDIIVHKEGAKNLHNYYAFTNGSEFQGIVSADGRWKLHLPHPYRTVVKGGTGGMAGKYQQALIDTALYDLLHDPYEKSNLLEAFPDVAQLMIEHAEGHKKKFFAK